jgi:hypothetical protein
MSGDALVGNTRLHLHRGKTWNPGVQPNRSESHKTSTLLGLDKVWIALQRSGTFLIDKQGIVRYIHQVTNPQASVDKEGLMREVEQL